MGHTAAEMGYAPPTPSTHGSHDARWCWLCHKVWPCPDVSGVAELRRLVAALTERVAELEPPGFDGKSDG